MKGKTLSLIGIISAAIGVGLIIFYKSITEAGVVVTAGVLFIVAGVLNLIIIGESKREGKSGAKRVLNQVTNIAAVVLGICLIIFKTTFLPYLAIVFGCIIALCALWQFFVLAISIRPIILPAWHYVFPFLLTAGAIYAFTQRHTTPEEKRAMVELLTTGCSLAVMGAGCLLEGSALGMANRRKAHADALAQQQQAAVQASSQAAAPVSPSTPVSPSFASESESGNQTTENLDDPASIHPEKSEN